MQPYEQFIQIPGPNPILRPGDKSDWDGGVIEACDVLKDDGVYYLYYHGTATDGERWHGGYRVGVATAPGPLGPFRKHSGPALDLGAPGEWDDLHVACAYILKRGASEYLMWYSGMSQEERSQQQGWVPGEERWSIGLATADSPLGPWTKHPANPILPRFGYVGGVVLKNGKYHLYTEYPIGSRGPDYAPLSLAVAHEPEGPYTLHGANPVLNPGDWGEWDDGGFSESEVSYSGGLFHCFYGGAKLHPVRIQSQESIGYAWSEDGIHFTKYPGPVALREHNPDATAFAEVHHLIEPPLVYCYHTLRYASRPGDEDLGVQVLATQRPFCVTMPVQQVERLGPGEATELADCPPISLQHVQSAALVLEATFGDDATSGLGCAIHGSADGLTFETSPQQKAGVPPESATSRRIVPITACGAFLKLTVTNTDAAHEVRDIQVSVILKG